MSAKFHQLRVSLAEGPVGLPALKRVLRQPPFESSRLNGNFGYQRLLGNGLDERSFVFRLAAESIVELKS